MNVRRLAALAAVVSVVLAPVRSAADSPAPGGAAAAGRQMALSLRYDGVLLVKVLEIRIEERASASGFGSSARLTSSGILALLKHIDYQATSQGRIVGGRPRPGTFEYQHLSGKSHRRAKVSWGEDDVELDAAPPFKDLGDPPATQAQKLAAADPLTTLMRVTLDGSQARACGRTYLLFDGKQLYALELSNQRPTPRTLLEQSLGLVNHFRCDVRYRKLAGFGKKKDETHKPGPEHPIELDFAEVGDGGPWVVSKLQAHTPFGPATVELKGISLTGAVRAG